MNSDELLQSRLERIPWDTTFLFEDIDDILNALETILKEVLDQNFPWENKRVKRRSQPPWMNDDIFEIDR